MTLAGQVAIARARDAAYPAPPPFHPERAYPEYPFAATAVSAANPVYEGVREALALLGLDRGRYDSREWNPLGEVVTPGDKVVVKPNFVMHYNHGGGPLEAVVTHASVLRAVIDFVSIALRGSGRICVADAPQSDCRFDVLRSELALGPLFAFYAQHGAVPVQLIDVRETVYHYDREKGYLARGDRSVRNGDPLGYADIDLGVSSALEGLEGIDRLYGADYDRGETITAHRNGSHRYRISRTMLDADAFISVPKLKIHRKVGITVNVKGLVGINGNKNFIVHHRIGGPVNGGDEYPADAPLTDRGLFSAQRWIIDRLLSKKSRLGEALYAGLLKAYRTVAKPLGLRPTQSSIRGGDWWGNDTAWRMMMDLAAIILYANRDGVMQLQRQRRLFSVVDGIIGGQGEGPLRPDPHRAGVIVAGMNLFVVDAICARLMGLDFRCLRWLRAALAGFYGSVWPEDLSEVEVVTNEPSWQEVACATEGSYLAFRPPVGWRSVLPWSTAQNRVSLNRWVADMLYARVEKAGTPKEFVEREGP